MRNLVLPLILSLLAATSASAGEYILPDPADRVNVTVVADSTYDSQTGLYHYTYELTSEADSEQNVDVFALELFGGSISDIQSPSGWSGIAYLDGSLVSWGSTEGDVPPDWIDDGNIPPSSTAMEPGEVLGGFSFKSRRPPVTVTYYAQGEVPLPVAVTDVDDPPAEASPPLQENSYIGTTTGPDRPIILLVVSGTCPGEFTLSVSGGDPDEPVALMGSLETGTELLEAGPCEGTLTDLGESLFLMLQTFDESGEAFFTGSLSLAACGLANAQAIAGDTCVVSNPVALP